MIKVRSPLQVEADAKGGWNLIFWFEAFDYSTPFRAILAEIAVALGVDARRDLRLPSYSENEDFIEGTLQFGTIALGVYYEHSLGYLSLFSDSEIELRDAADKIQKNVSLVSSRTEIA